MKAVFCMYGPNGLGGPATWVRRMLPRLTQRGIEVAAVSYHTEEGECAVVADLRNAGVDVEVVAAHGLAPVDGISRVVAALTRLRPEVVVADHVVPAFLAGGWAARHGVRTVMVIRSDDTWYHHLMDSFLAGDDSLRVGAVVAVSRELCRAAEDFAAGRVPVVLCPSSTPIPRERAGWRAKPFHAIYLGRLDQEQKRIRELVRGLIGTSRSMPEFEASLFGDGPLRGEIESVLAAEGGHRVAYRGRIEPAEVFPWLLRSQALVLLSGYEGLSSAIQEAMACGLPVIARRTASGSEGVLMDGRTALVLDSDDQLPGAIARLLHSEALWCTLSDGARRLAELEFDIEGAADRWAALLSDLGRGACWTGDVEPGPGEVERAYLAYLSRKMDLEAFEARYLAERGSAASPGLWRFLASAESGWEPRRSVLHKAVTSGAITRSDAAPTAHCLAREGETADDQTEARRYRIASLLQLAGELEGATARFSDIEKTTCDLAIHSGCRFHLAEIAREQGRFSDAITNARACLDIEPRHRAARVLLDALVSRPPGPG